MVRSEGSNLERLQSRIRSLRERACEERDATVTEQGSWKGAGGSWERERNQAIVHLQEELEKTRKELNDRDEENRRKCEGLRARLETAEDDAFRKAEKQLVKLSAIQATRREETLLRRAMKALRAHLEEGRAMHHIRARRKRRAFRVLFSNGKRRKEWLSKRLNSRSWFLHQRDGISLWHRAAARLRRMRSATTVFFNIWRKRVLQSSYLPWRWERRRCACLRERLSFVREASHRELMVGTLREWNKLTSSLPKNDERVSFASAFLSKRCGLRAVTAWKQLVDNRHLFQFLEAKVRECVREKWSAKAHFRAWKDILVRARRLHSGSRALARGRRGKKWSLWRSQAQLALSLWSQARAHAKRERMIACTIHRSRLRGVLWAWCCQIRVTHRKGRMETRKMLDLWRQALTHERWANKVILSRQRLVECRLQARAIRAWKWLPWVAIQQRKEERLSEAEEEVRQQLSAATEWQAKAERSHQEKLVLKRRLASTETELRRMRNLAPGPSTEPLFEQCYHLKRHDASNRIPLRMSPSESVALAAPIGDGAESPHDASLLLLDCSKKSAAALIEAKLQSPFSGNDNEKAPHLKPWKVVRASGDAPRRLTDVAACSLAALGCLVVLGGYDPAAGEEVASLHVGKYRPPDKNGGGTSTIFWSASVELGGDAPLVPRSHAVSCSLWNGLAALVFGGYRSGVGSVAQPRLLYPAQGEGAGPSPSRWIVEAADEEGDVPFPRRNCGLVSFGDGEEHACLFGGASTHGQHGDMYVFTTNNGRRIWEQVASEDEPGPGPREAPAMAGTPSGRAIVLIGGWRESEGALQDIWVRLLGKGVWLKVEPASSPRMHCLEGACLMFTGNQFIAFGGRRWEAGESCLETGCYTIGSSHWEEARNVQWQMHEEAEKRDTAENSLARESELRKAAESERQRLEEASERVVDALDEETSRRRRHQKELRSLRGKLDHERSERSAVESRLAFAESRMRHLYQEKSLLENRLAHESDRRVRAEKEPRKPSRADASAQAALLSEEEHPSPPSALETTEGEERPRLLAAKDGGEDVSAMREELRRLAEQVEQAERSRKAAEVAAEEARQRERVAETKKDEAERLREEALAERERMEQRLSEVCEGLDEHEMRSWKWAAENGTLGPRNPSQRYDDDIQPEERTVDAVKIFRGEADAFVD